MNIVFLGNCQAHSLAYIYDRHFGARSGQTVTFVDRRRTPDDQTACMRSADLVVQQLFGSQPMLEIGAIPATARMIAFPDVRGSFLWPHGNVPRIDNPTPWYLNAGPYDPEVGDRFLNKLLRDGVDPEEAVERYRTLDIARVTSLDRFYELMLDQQRRRDDEAGIETAEFIDARFREERLFLTQGHLDLPLFNHLARQLYRAMGVDAGAIDTALSREMIHPFEPFHEAPIHPGVIAHYGLRYVDADSRYYHLHEGRFTFDEYVRRYMRADWCPELHEACARLHEPDHEAVLALFDVALARAGQCGHGYEKKAHLLQLHGRYAEAVEAMEQAVRLDPDYAYFRAVLADYRRRAVETAQA